MTIENKIEQARQIFLTDVNIEDKEIEFNKNKIREWEQSLRTNNAFAQWQDSDISKMLIKEFKTTYKNASLELAQTRDLSESKRMSLWATKDACLMVLSLLAKDAKNEIESVEKEIDYALNST